MSSLRSTIWECDSALRTSLQPLHSPPKPDQGVAGCLPRWSLGSLRTGALPSLYNPRQTLSCWVHWTPSQPLPSSFHLLPPLLSTFNLLGIIGSVFFLYLIFCSHLFITFKPLLDRSRPWRLQGEGRVGCVSAAALWQTDVQRSSGPGIHHFHFPDSPCPGALVAVTSVSRKPLECVRVTNSQTQ